MADMKTPTPEDEARWAEWVAALPEQVRTAVGEIKPWKLYRLKSSGHRVFIISFSSSDAGVSCSVHVGGKYNHVAFERNVFGIALDDLEECELPAPGEPLGSRNEDPMQHFAAMKRDAAKDLPN